MSNHPLPPALRKLVSLRFALSSSGLDVDVEAGVIRGAAVMRIGPAQGHGFSIDATTLKQVEALGNAQAGGVKMRFQHPEVGEDGLMPDDLGDVIGHVTNLRIDGDTLRGDVHLEDFAACLPGRGDVRTYLLKRAKAQPESLGLSAVMWWKPEPVTDAGGGVTDVIARVDELDAIDFVGRGAATPNGLLSAKEPPAPPADPMAAALAAVRTARATLDTAWRQLCSVMAAKSAALKSKR